MTLKSIDGIYSPRYGSRLQHGAVIPRERERSQSVSRVVFTILFAIMTLGGSALAQDTSECLMCHEDRTLRGKRGGRTISVFVDAKKLSSSVHADITCVSCHEDLEGKELPHEDDLKPVQCGTCHTEEGELYKECLHGKARAKGDPLAPRCRDCHGYHDILPVKDRRSAVAPMRVPFLCGRCHREGSPVQLQRQIPQSRILENYSESIHGEGLLKKGLSVSATCVSCHTAHRILPHTDSRSTIARRNITSTCTQCHVEIEAVHEKVIRGELWEKQAHVLPACVDCHQPHRIRNVFYEQGMADRDCLDCHERRDLKASDDGRSLYVDRSELTDSRHQKVACSQCHSGVNIARKRPCEDLAEKKVDCSACHAEVGLEYQQSIHGTLGAKNDPNAPSCKECHGKHTVLGRLDPKSPTFPTNIPTLCARCHREGQKAAVRYGGKQHEIIEHYTESIHGKGLLKSGLTVTATCTDCHTAHRELPHENAESTINRANIASTCGNCHHGIREQFIRSVHSPAVSHSKKELPVCSECHTAHTIRRTDQEGFRLEIMNNCGRCHEDVARTYFDTFHGKVSQLGYAKAAKCYDCHGAHDILPVENPKSHLSRENVVATCQKCHPGATRRFAGYFTHATHHDPHKYPWLFYTFWGMTSLLIGVFFFGGVHTLLWLPRAFQTRRKHAKNPTNPNGKQYVRFTRLSRVLHGFMIVSFLSLALTGLTLKFSYTKWAVVLSRLLGGFESTGNIHRMAAVIMFGVFAVHLYDLVLKKRENRQSWREMLFGPNTLLPNRKDLADLVGSIKWFIGLGEKPQYGRWTYWEKFDYFAVFWGIFVIGFTGLSLWFPEFFTQVLPGWVINVATIIHSDEALLAAGFIFTVHFFNTHLRPEIFPMDTVIFTGRVPVEELKRDRPEEYQLLTRSGELEKHLAEPYPPAVLRVVRVFGGTALAIGFGIVIWIVYAMIFAYR